MSQTGDKSVKKGDQYTFNLTLVAVAGQVGCLTLVIVLLALFGGLWLDNRLGTRPWFTVLLMLGSVPVTLIVMFKVVRLTTSRMKSDSNSIPEENVVDREEDTDLGRD